MARKVWEFELDGRSHKVELDHKYFSGKRTIWIDGENLKLDFDKAQRFLDTGSDHDFKIGNHICTITIRTNGLTFNYDLVIDGISKTTGKEFTGKMTIEQNWSIYWGKIENKNLAEKILKNTFWVILTVTGLSAIVMSVAIGQFSGWLDVILMGLIALWLYKRQSQIAGILLIIMSGLSMVLTSMNNIRPTTIGVGGSNILAAIFPFWFSIRGFQAARWLNQNKKV